MRDIKNSPTYYSAARSYKSTAIKDLVVGFDDDLLAIQDQLSGESRKLQIIPIIGTGGIGKTTLARNAYNDQLIRESFHVGGWVTVSQSYSFQQILSTLLQSLKPFNAKRIEENKKSGADVSKQGIDESEAKFFTEGDEIAAAEMSEEDDRTRFSTAGEMSGSPAAEVFEHSLDSMGDQVTKTLKGKKYLVVIDDIWNTQVLDHLKWLLPEDRNGSRIILTTRMLDVAAHTKDCRSHEMRLLNEDQSWDLFRHKVFTDGVCDPELEHIGMEIARSCGGLPLAIVVIAGLLSTVDRTRASWEEIAEKVSSSVAARESQLEKILCLSYTLLPRHLRQCFVYTGGFPGDREIHVVKLIKLWIAEGFIRATTASKSLEEEGEECFQHLIKRSLVSVATRKPHGEIKNCSLHELMRGFCVRKADEEKFPLYKVDVDETLVERLKLGSLEDVKVIDVVKYVLDPSPAGQELYAWLPKQIFRLSNLRYLVLAYFGEIPAAILYLENLQTLSIYGMGDLVRLPEEIWKMPQLRHLISSFDQLPCPEGEATSRLDTLQTLSEVSNLEFTDWFVETIPFIKKLGLVYSASYEFQQHYHLDDLFSLHQHGNQKEYNYHLENLERLQQLQKLKVQVYPGFQGMFNPAFPQSLIKLSLSGWRLTSWNQMTIIGSLPNLQVLKIRDIMGQDEIWETTEGEFPRLSFLLIERSDLREWITEAEHFPSLKQLLLHYCCCLDEIPAAIGDIPTLELIEVKEGSTFLVESVKRIEEKLKNVGNSSFHARSRPSISGIATAIKDVVVGLDNDLLAIKERLFGESSSLRVIPIVGMGGIGKTTLARNAYHDPLIRESFHIGGWVTVSQSYSFQEILSTLLQSLKPFVAKQLKKSSHESEAEFFEESDDYAAKVSKEGVADMSVSPAKVYEQSPESTGDEVYKTLKGRKYLVVMDDIWNTEVLHLLKRLLPNDYNRSRIILTTRLQDVATYAEDCSPHEMRLMHEDQSWDLLRQKVFAKGVINRKLEDIGRAIARSCGGLPLAIVVIAGLLSTVKRNRASWEAIAEKVSSTVATRDGKFEKILSLSYTLLPRHLRQCFVYMGGFPEDHEIPVAKLIKLWIAEGFVRAITATRSLEEEGEECFKDLIKRSLVLVGKRKPQGGIKSCSLHDLMKELCVRKADEEKFPLHDVDANGTLVERLKEGCLEDVRVMNIEKYVMDPSSGPELYTWIPEQIFRLSNLRYLVLAYIVEIPAAVSYLENLQTFIIYALEGLVRLPPEIWTMPQLRHLVSSFDQLPFPRGGTSSGLENLQTLSDMNNLECTYQLVEMIPNIKKLGLVYSTHYEFHQAYHLEDLFSLHQLENPSNPPQDDHLDNFISMHQLEHLFNPTRDHDYHLENLERLQQLEKLKVQVYAGFQGMFNPVFPQSLKKLSLSGWRLPSWNHMTIVGSLPNLEELKLRDFSLKRWETTEGEFTRLSFMLIQRSNLEDWITESEHFPRLKQLLLHYCWCLNKIPSVVGDIPTLELIEVGEGSTSLVASAKRIEEEQKEMGNESLQVRCTEINNCA